MATWGPYSTSNTYIKYQIVLTEGGISGRSRLVNVKVQAWRTNSGYTTDDDGTVYVTINGTQYSNSWVYGNLPITQNSYTTFFNKDVYVACDTAGNGTISVSAYFSHDRFTSSSQGSSMSVTNIGATTASFNLNVLLPDGSEPYTTGAAGSLEFSSNGGSSYSRVYNEPASSYAIGTAFRFRNFTPGTGLYLSSVSGASLSGGVYAATLTSSGLTVNFQTAWTQYPLQIDPNGGYRVSDGSTSVISVNKTYGQIEAISERASANYILGGYTLKNTSTGSTAAADLGGASFTFDDTTKTGTFTQGTVACTLVANWILDAYVITFENNGGSGGPTTQAINANETGVLTVQTPSRLGYSFRGWDTSSDAVTPVYLPGDSITLTEDITLYAVWDIWTYTLTFDANGGSGEVPDDVFLMGTEVTTIGSKKPKAAKRTFILWNTAADGSGDSYYPGDVWKTPSQFDVTLYAMYLGTDIYFNKDGSIECVEFVEDASVVYPQLQKNGRIVAAQFIEHDGGIIFEKGIVYANEFIEKERILVPGVDAVG